MGIKALLGNIDISEDLNASAEIAPQNKKEAVKQLLKTVAEIPINEIEANPFQPRRDFDQEKLQELSESIKIHGLVQPITVRVLTQNQYQLIAGERRWRASKLAGLTHIPAYIRTANDQAMLEMALIENIQRENLNPVEIALTYQRMIDECSLKHEDLGDRVGKKRSTVSNYLRLLKLPPEIQKALKNKDISMGHARALVNIDRVEVQLDMFRKIIDNGLSVRQAEALRKAYNDQERISNKSKGGRSKRLPIHYRKIQENLEAHFGAKVDLKRNEKGKGQIVIAFSNDEDLNRILEVIQDEA